jgi:Raf kinase inhibitor-like YbhB/YbcL family protein
MTIVLTSRAFADHQPIPKKHTGEGQDVSPQLGWSQLPAATREIALICDDPDAPTAEPFVHWVLYMIPAATKELAEDSNGGGVEGMTSFGYLGYGGPMPPVGHGLHHYHFKIYALSAPLRAKAGLTKAGLLEAMKGLILDQGELVGVYERKA